MSLNKDVSDAYAFEFSSGARFPVNFYLTTDCYTVELPCGVYEAEMLRDLNAIMRREFRDVRMVKR